MKKYWLLLVLCQSLFAQKVEPEVFNYQDGVNFTIKKIRTAKFAEYGDSSDQTLYIARKGSTFKSAVMEFTNSNDHDIIIDFEQIFLLDNNGDQHEVESVMQTKKLTTSVEKYQMTLKAGKTRTYLVQFWPTFSREEITDEMIVNDVKIRFKYLKK